MELVFPDFRINAFLLFAIMVAASPLIIFLLSRGGWKALADRYELMQPYHGVRIGITSARINTINYNRILLIKCNDTGIFLQPVFIFRLFHPAIMIPWSEIPEVKVESSIFVKTAVMTVGSPRIAKIELSYATFARLEKYLQPGSGNTPARR